jgi:lipopolysaccharide transport system ATP-binding protein
MQILKYRFTVKQIDSLLKIKWWDWDDEKIMGNIDYFYGDVDNFIEKFST